MALARIITRNSGDASELSTELRERGFEIEVVSPEAETSGAADLVVRLEEVDAEEAFRQVESIPENQDVTVFVAPGAIAGARRYQEIRLCPEPAPPVQITPAPLFVAVEPATEPAFVIADQKDEEPAFAQTDEEATFAEAEPLALEEPAFAEEAPAFLDVNDEPAFAMAEADPIASAEPVTASEHPADAGPIVGAQPVLAAAPVHEPAFETEPTPADPHDPDLVQSAMQAHEAASSAALHQLLQESGQQPAHNLDYESHFAPLSQAPYEMPRPAQSPQRPNKLKIASSRKAADARFWKIAAAVAAVALLALGLGAGFHRLTPLPDAFANAPSPNVQPTPFKKATGPATAVGHPAVPPARAVVATTAAKAKPQVQPQPVAVVPVRTTHKPSAPRKAARKSHVAHGDDLVAEDTVVRYGSKGSPHAPAPAKTTVKHYSDLN